MATEQMSSRRSRVDGVELGEFERFVPSEKTRSLVGRTAAVLEMVDGVLEQHDHLTRVVTVEDIAEAAEAVAAMSETESLPQIRFMPRDEMPSGGKSWDDDNFVPAIDLNLMDGAIGSSYWNRAA